MKYVLDSCVALKWVLLDSDPDKALQVRDERERRRAVREKYMTVSFEIPQEIEQQIRTSGVDLGRDAKEVYLMEQYRQAKITHRQLEDALDLSFHETEQLLKERGMGQDMDSDEFEAGREFLRKARTQ
jgi:Uncharacterised protein family (UPF0175)